MKSRNIPVITIAPLLAVLGGMALAAQDKYTVQVPKGLALSECRGYEDWRLSPSVTPIRRWGRRKSPMTSSP